jgi:uncharacterized damage-inducible protein DinB
VRRTDGALPERQLAVLEELFDDLAALLGSLDPDCANWTAPEPNANSIADLVRHVAGSLDAWLSRALDEPFERDRDAEFEAFHSPPELLAAVERSREKVREQFARLDGIDPGTVRRFRRLGEGEETEQTAAWCVAHAVNHAGEHWGQIQVIRDRCAAPG